MILVRILLLTKLWGLLHLGFVNYELHGSKCRRRIFQQYDLKRCFPEHLFYGAFFLLRI